MSSDDELQMIELAEVRALTGLSTSTIYARPDFPAPISLTEPGRRTKAVRWLKAEVVAWLRACIARRDAKAVERRKNLTERRERNLAQKRIKPARPPSRSKAEHRAAAK